MSRVSRSPKRPRNHPRKRPRRLDDDALDGAFAALGSPVRREILRLVSVSPRAVGEIADALPAGMSVSRPAVSKHLRLLEGAGLVSFDVDGKRNVYRVRREGFADARTWLDAFWDEALARFAMVAENTRERRSR
jgi:DNA-binding transcriptional ArsR family regulator